MKKKLQLDYIIPILVAAAFILLGFTPFLQTGENSVYDLFLHLKPELEEREEILLLDVDDLAIAKVGVWPWSRSVMADGLIVLKEFEAAYAIFDIEYTEESPLGVNSSFLNEDIPELFSYEFSSIRENIRALFNAIAEGHMTPAAAADYIGDLEGLTEESRKRLLANVHEIARDNDEYLGRAAHFFENSYFTVNMLPEEDTDVPEELKKWAGENISISVDSEDTRVPHTAEDIRPAIFPILARAGGAGFPNIIIDEDGVRRGVNLLYRWEDTHFGQLAFAPLLHWLGEPKVQRKENSITITGAKMPTGVERDITMPLTEEGHFLINWPKKNFPESYRHLSFYYLYLHNEQEQTLLHNLQAMKEAGYLNYYGGETPLLDVYEYAESLKQEVFNGAAPSEYVGEWRQVREFFFDETEDFLNGTAEEEITDELDAYLESGTLSETEQEEILAIKEDVETVFTNTREIYSDFAETRAILREQLPGAFCIIGHTGTSTTDRGVNPFSKEYDNVGTHASVVNTILTGRFLDYHPQWYSMAAALLLTFFVFFIIRGFEPLPSMIVGVVLIALIIGAGLVYFLLTGIYFAMLIPVLSVFFTFVFMTVLKFLLTSREKSYIRNAFGHYLNTDVINELLSDPDKLKLGGEQKNLTAFFTDIKGFSSISEQLEPSDLVKLLNIYLTNMSDIILELRGTIDKYEGDAIISFFGAPVELSDHPERACLSAVKMKRMERELNKQFLDNKLAPSPLHTRIGINTGPMVVGNMGTATKMDYTIMGNSVNLAARLEGVNKQYGTWILMSENTHKEAGDRFLTRRLDRVRVVGINQPVRLYELVEENDAAEADLKEKIKRFHVGLALFEERHWEEATRIFEKVLEMDPEDGPAATYKKRCADFLKKPPTDTWDGVFTLSTK